MNVQNSYSGSGTNIFLDLEIYNNKTTEQQAILKYSGNNLIDVQSHMWPYKFTLNTSNYPLYVPTLVNTFTPYNLDSNTQTIINNPNNYYMMDWTITVKFTDGSSKTTPILWEKYGFRQPFIEPLINNKYFWLDNSDQLCEFLTSAFERILGSNQVYFVKNADRWSLLINTKNTTLVSIHFNDAMKNLFPFNFVENNGILLKYKLQTLTTLTDSFYKITTSTTNNKLFPFD
ncbi:MAG TPA: hypothetical protein VFQ56_10205, partial [Flavobacterium sp.]|nr:hypothetical protein [Flavobacterium sp.]